MFFYVVAGVFSAFAIIFLLAKFDFGKVLWLDIPIDIASTALLVAMFAGTFAGMMAAVIGGASFLAFSGPPRGSGVTSASSGTLTASVG